MARLTSDPLLASARLIVAGMMGLFAFVALSVTIGLGAALTFKRPDLASQLAEAGVPPSGYAATIAILVLIIALLVIGVLFLRHLLRIIRSVGESDPFNPVNADRLRAMAWMTLSAQPLLWVLGLIAHWFRQFSDKVDADVGISLGGIVMALVLFILARVFRTGTEMREELEGTV